MAFDPFNHNSSDVEPDNNPPPSARLSKAAGQASIERMVTNAGYNRNRSKTTINDLHFDVGPPGTVYAKSLWVNRFNAFRSDVLGQPLDRPFTQVHLLRFLDRILDNLKLARGKLAPSVAYFESACKMIIKYGEWSWPDFSFGRHDYARLRTFIGQCVDDKRLMRGSFYEKTWIGFVTLSRLVRNYLRHFLDNGTVNFDVIISRCLAIVLQSALCCRSGDIALSHHYKAIDGTFLRYEHIELYLDGDPHPTTGTVTLANLRAIIELAYLKGHKNVHNDSTFKHLQPLLAADCHHVCPITLLLIHALRHDLLEGGTTIQAVLDYANSTPSRRLIWKYPKRPVLAATKIGSQAIRCYLDEPAGGHAARRTLKDMGLISGVLTRMYPHALRRGAARDLRSIKDITAGTTSVENVGRILNHTARATFNGVTDMYTGDLEVDTYSLRANAKPETARGPQFVAEDGPNLYSTAHTRPTAAKLAAYIADGQHTLKPKDINASVKRQRLDDLVATATAEPRRSLKRKAEAALPSPVPETSSRHCGNIPTPLRELSTNFVQRPKDAATSTFDPASAGDDDRSDLDTTPRHLIDPRLLDEDALAALQVPQQALDDFSARVFPRHEDGACDDRTTTPLNLPDFDLTSNTDSAAIDLEQSDETARLLDIAAPSTAAGLQRPDGSAIAFIDQHSRYNVVRNTKVREAWQLNNMVT
ncbi:hypothetical protein LTR37_015201 [Vermiconidia calcicola]|uniref:Uncharacterized protein n=1 Tax=Vermiconidia calcicola TaxID=1690605 RepID=A0ACC3MRG1_9PEZI|nr:hypothetical protein LTR37_015201 [Vermiconidia calcicola]